MPKISFVRWFSCLQVGQKISLGYTLALGVAVSGTIAGFSVGHYYRQQSAQREDHARNKVELLHRLQTGILQMRTHQQQLIPLLPQPEDFQLEYEHAIDHKAAIEQTFTELQAFVDRGTDGEKNIHGEKISNFLQTYRKAPEQYFQEMDRLVKRIRSSNLVSPENAEQAQKSLLSFTNSDLALKFDGMSDDLVELIEQSYDEAHKAEQEDQESIVIVQRIVVGSITLSVAIAILLAILTSRAIAQPLQVLTRVAQRTTKESDFDLQAPITSNDEIGMLAQSFNHLIHSVKQLLEQQQITHEQLAAYSQTLEQKVEERTQELSNKNSQLQELLEKLHHSQIQVVQSEKMSSLGQLVAGVAHEINNPVNFIFGNLVHVREYAENLLDFVQLYQKHYPHPIAEIAAAAEAIDLEFLQDDLPKILSSMQMGTDRIRQIVLSLRNFSRTDEAEFKAVNIHEGINSTLLILQHRLQAKPRQSAIQVIQDYGDLPLVECYPGQLNQVLMNVLVNAIDALEEFNNKHKYQEIKESQIIIQTSVIDSQWVQITITDNGPGIPQQIQQKIFNPFFTTKPIGKGTGMGMSISYQIIVEKHGGKLDCFSTPAEGTKFVIQLPIKQQIARAN